MINKKKREKVIKKGFFPFLSFGDWDLNDKIK